MAELQVIPARHGTATFVPAGQVIKIVNTSGSQVIDTWAFALPKPEPKLSEQAQKKEAAEQKAKSSQTGSKAAQTKAKKKNVDLPSQEDAEKATQEGLKEGEEAADGASQEKATWSSYVTSRVWPTGQKGGSKDESKESQETEQQQNSRTWASYFPSGKGFSNYIPETARNAAGSTVSSFADAHKRDPNKTYMEQLQEFSKTPVGAAGLAALTGSGWGGSTLAGYQAYNAKNAANAPPMEFMSMSHSRAATLHLRPKVNDTLVSNLREPILTVIEDTSSGIHDTLIAACDPARYKGLGVEEWQEHGSCAENLVLALSELNERAGLKGAKGVGADVTINSVPAPLNLFMNIPWDDQGDLGFHAPKSKKGGFVRLKAERDLVVVMSACPQDILEINNKKPTDAHFLVEGSENQTEAIKRTQPTKKRPPPRKITSSHATSTVGTETGGPTAAKRPVPQKRTAPKQTGSATAQTNTAASAEKNAAAPAQKQTPAAQPAKKKPVPPAVTPQKKANVTSTDNTSGTATPVAEKKKPRKLTPKPAAQT